MHSVCGLCFSISDSSDVLLLSKVRNVLILSGKRPILSGKRSIFLPLGLSPVVMCLYSDVLISP